MAKLTGVKKVSDREIEYGGVRYEVTEGAAQSGDIVRSDTNDYVDVRKNGFYAVITKNGVQGFVDDAEDYRGIDDGFIGVDSGDLTVFLRVESVPQTPQTLAEIRALIAEKRAEIEELEAQISINVGDFVKTTMRTYNEEIPVGVIAKVTVVDGSQVPYKLRTVIGDGGDWATKDAVVKITPAEAKAALIAQVEELFAEEPAS